MILSGVHAALRRASKAGCRPTGVQAALRRVPPHRGASRPTTGATPQGCRPPFHGRRPIWAQAWAPSRTRSKRYGRRGRRRRCEARRARKKEHRARQAEEAAAWAAAANAQGGALASKASSAARERRAPAASVTTAIAKDSRAGYHRHCNGRRATAERGIKRSKRSERYSRIGCHRHCKGRRARAERSIERSKRSESYGRMNCRRRWKRRRACASEESRAASEASTTGLQPHELPPQMERASCVR